MNEIIKITEQNGRRAVSVLSMSEHAMPNPRTGEYFTKFTCYVTGKGQQYFINKFKTA